MATEAQRRANKRCRAKYTSITVQLTGNHADIIEKLESDEVTAEGKAAYVRRLIREDIARK